jgi:hypothetical protein
VQVVSDSNRRIEQTVGEARRAAEQFDTNFDVAKALVNISQVAAVQQGDLAKQVALVARQVASNPDVEDAAVRKDIDSLTEVRTYHWVNSNIILIVVYGSIGYAFVLPLVWTLTSGVRCAVPGLLHAFWVITAVRQLFISHRVLLLFHISTSRMQSFTGEGFEQKVIPLSSVITPAIIQVALEDPSSQQRNQNPDGSFDFDHTDDAAMVPRARSASSSSGMRSGSRAGAIVAGVLVSVVGAATLAAVIVCIVKRRQIAKQEWAHPLSKPLRISSSQNSASHPRFGPVVDSPRFTPRSGSPRSYSQDTGSSPRATYPGSPRFGGGIGSCGSPRANARLNAAGPLGESVMAVSEDALAQAAIASKAAERWRSFGGTSSDGGASVASVDTDGICTEGISASKPEPARCDPLKSARLHTQRSDTELPGISGGSADAAQARSASRQAQSEITAEPEQARTSLRPEDSSLGGALTEPYRASLSDEASDELPLPEVEPKAFMMSSNSLFEDEGVGLDEADQLPGWAPVRAPACHLLSLDEEDQMSNSSLGSK